MGSYRKIWIQHNGPIPKEPDGRSYQIHHIDGDVTNNEIDNLQSVTLHEHYNIHFSQGDYDACQLMGFKLKISPEEISRLASLNNKMRIENGTHHFLDGEKARQRNLKHIENGTHPWVGGLVQQKRLDNGTHHF